MITLGQLREHLAAYPDDTPIIIERTGFGEYYALAEIIDSERVDPDAFPNEQGAQVDAFGAWDCDFNGECAHDGCRWSKARPVILLLPERAQ